MIILDAPQRSDAWRQARVGLLTGSRAGDMLATIKGGGESAKRRDLRLQLACERVTGRSAEDRYQTRDMQRGIDQEPAAVAAYEAARGVFVDAVGFIRHPDLWAGCSPDGLVDGGGLIEIKCPKSTTHMQYLIERRLPTEYLGQVTHNLWITGAAWCDFVSYDDRFPPPLQLAIVHVPRQDALITAYEIEARRFLADVENESAKLLACVAEAVA